MFNLITCICIQSEEISQPKYTTCLVQFAPTTSSETGWHELESRYAMHGARTECIWDLIADYTL